MINKFIYDSENLKITIVIIHERRIQLSSKGEGTQDGQSATLPPPLERLSDSDRKNDENWLLELFQTVKKIQFTEKY